MPAENVRPHHRRSVGAAAGTILLATVVAGTARAESAAAVYPLRPLLTPRCCTWVEAQLPGGTCTTPAATRSWARGPAPWPAGIGRSASSSLRRPISPPRRDRRTGRTISGHQRCSRSAAGTSPTSRHGIRDVGSGAWGSLAHPVPWPVSVWWRARGPSVRRGRHAIAAFRPRLLTPPTTGIAPVSTFCCSRAAWAVRPTSRSGPTG